MHTIFECYSINTLWYEIKGLFNLTGENYEIFAHPDLNHLSLALIAQLIYNRIRITRCDIASGIKLKHKLNTQIYLIKTCG